MVKLRPLLLLPALLLPVAGMAASSDGLFDAAGFRAASWRAPVDRDPDPARVIGAPAVHDLEPTRGALLIDVLPAESAQRDPVTGRWTLASPHQTLPGALWYPETGRSPPPPVLWQALLARVRQFRRSDAAAPVVVFCRADCWMSWNAARRLALSGIDGVFWYPDGIEGWHDHGWPLVDARPVPVADPASP